MKQVQGRVAVVTGAVSGSGRGMAEAFAAAVQVVCNNAAAGTDPVRSAPPLD